LVEFGSFNSWVGGNDFLKEGIFLSESGSNCNFFYWHANEPNDWGRNEDCVMLAGVAMNDYNCAAKMAVTCKTFSPLDPSAIVNLDNIQGYETSIHCPSKQIYSRNGMK